IPRSGCRRVIHPLPTRRSSELCFATLAGRLANQDALDALVGEWTRGYDARQLMIALQQAGVPAGVCQTTAERCDIDPQLRALERSEEHTSELQSLRHLVCRLLL